MAGFVRYEQHGMRSYVVPRTEPAYLCQTVHHPPAVRSFSSVEDRRMDKTKLEKLARLSGKAASKAPGALERRGYDLRGKLSAPINRVPRRSPPAKPKSDGGTLRD